MSVIRFKTQELTDVHWCLSVPVGDEVALSRMSTDEQAAWINERQSDWKYVRQGTSETVELAGSPKLEPDNG